jgi:hypothetical protein
MSGIRILRTARAAVFAVVCVALAWIAHTVGGGTVSTRAVAFGLLAVAGPALALAWRERSLGPILATLGITQAGLHLLFSVLCPALAPPAAEAGMAHAGNACMPSLGMLLMHLWAVGMTAWWLERAERMVWTLLRGLFARALDLLLPSANTATVLDGSAGPRTRPSGSASPAPMLLRHAVSRRGPPLPIAAVFG